MSIKRPFSVQSGIHSFSVSGGKLPNFGISDALAPTPSRYGRAAEDTVAITGGDVAAALLRVWKALGARRAGGKSHPPPSTSGAAKLLLQRERIKRKTIEQRRLQHRKATVQNANSAKSVRQKPQFI
jgi:hypothetical protein